VHDRLIAEFPDRCEGWLLRSNRYALSGDARRQLADLRETDRRMPRDHSQRLLVDTAMANLNQLAGWEDRLPEILTGGPLPEPHEWLTLANYCVKFDKNYAWAAEFADRLLELDPAHQTRLAVANDIFLRLSQVTEYAKWALLASDREGIGEQERSHYRLMALRWLNRFADRLDQRPTQQAWNALVGRKPEFLRYTNTTELRKQPAEEQAEWERFVEKAGPLKK
jgi:hypothetical protein